MDRKQDEQIRRPDSLQRFAPNFDGPAAIPQPLEVDRERRVSIRHPPVELHDNVALADDPDVWGTPDLGPQCHVVELDSRPKPRREQRLPRVPYVRLRDQDVDVAFREAADLDILIPRTDVRDAREALLAAGFRPRVEFDDVALRTKLRHTPHIWVISESDIVVELHWRVTYGYSPFPIDFDRLWGRRQTIEIGGEPLQSIRPTDLLVLLSVHGHKHGWEALCWLCDFAAAVRTFDVEWERILESAAERGGERMLLVGCELADRLLDVDPPAAVERRRRRGDVVDSLASRVEECFLWADQVDTLENVRYQFAVRERWRDRARRAARMAVIPNRTDLEVLPERARYYPLAVAVRPFRVAIKASRLLAERATARQS